MWGVTLSSFKNLLKETRLQSGFTQKEMAIRLELSERAYQHYEAGTREPNITYLIAIADILDVSLDYLVGRTDNPEVNH
jgi:transcriptional regulator with XRE-family HTH domain